jgi:hypothetical protein
MSLLKALLVGLGFLAGACAAVGAGLVVAMSVAGSWPSSKLTPVLGGLAAWDVVVVLASAVGYAIFLTKKGTKTGAVVVLVIIHLVPLVLSVLGLAGLTLVLFNR